MLQRFLEINVYFKDIHTIFDTTKGIYNIDFRVGGVIGCIFMHLSSYCIFRSIIDVAYV